MIGTDIFLKKKAKNKSILILTLNEHGLNEEKTNGVKNSRLILYILQIIIVTVK